MHALLIGATGATGRDLLDLLLEDNFFHRVDIFVRREPEIRHQKLHTHVIDFEKPEQWKHLVSGDVLFSCLGTTLKTAGSKEAQWKVDYTYQYEFARIARENNVSDYVLVSSGFSSPESRFFYTRMKGQLEKAVKALGFPSMAIFNPPALVRKRSDRRLEVVGVKVIRLLNRFGFFRPYSPMPTKVLAQGMINVAKAGERGILMLHAAKIWEWANTPVK